VAECSFKRSTPPARRTVVQFGADSQCAGQRAFKRVDLHSAKLGRGHLGCAARPHRAERDCAGNLPPRGVHVHGNSGRGDRAGDIHLLRQENNGLHGQESDRGLAQEGRSLTTQEASSRRCPPSERRTYFAVCRRSGPAPSEQTIGATGRSRFPLPFPTLRTRIPASGSPRVRPTRPPACASRPSPWATWPPRCKRSLPSKLTVN